MSIRSATRTIAPLARARVGTATRALSSTTPRRAGHSEHGQDDAGAETHESFFSPAMRNSLLFTALFALAYPYLPSPSTGSASPSLSPDAQAQTSTSKDVPLITRLIAQYTPSAKTWSERNDKHLELVKDAAEERLLFQEAERTRVWRWRNASAFEQASPHRIAVGSQADLSDLKVKRD